MWTCTLLLLVGCTSVHVWGQSGPLVQTDKGPVRGTTEQLDGQTYDRFLGIPFANSTEGLNRFEQPVPAEPWTEEFLAYDFGPHCPHFVANFYHFMGLHNITGEDCLHLSIWVPGSVDTAQDLPVMVWYYGGAYILGTHAMYPGEELALFGNVIVVGFNYRVNSMGFLSTGDEYAPGNYGLWDAKAALTWVQDNIAAFGGDPDRVTIVGQSAGAALVSHSVVTPEMVGLFHRAIPISGGSSGFFGLVDPVSAHETAKTVANIFRCGANTNEEIVDCLRQQDADALAFWSVIGVTIFRQQLPNYLPAVDGVMIPVNPLDVWATTGPASQVDFLSGHTHHDSAGFVLLNVLGSNSTIAHNGGWCATNDSLDRALHFIMNGYGNPDELVDYVYDRYPMLLSDDVDDRTMATTNVTTDWWFASTAHYEASMHSGNGHNTYVYDFHYRQSFLEYPEWVEGSHLDDVYSFFGEVFMEDYVTNILENEWSEEDRITSSNVMSYYTNFAYSGDPNIGPSAVPAQWEQYDPSNRRFMVMNDNPSMSSLSQEKADEYSHWVMEWQKEVVEPQTPTNDSGPTLPEGCDPDFPPDPDCMDEILPDFPFTISPEFPFPPEEDSQIYEDTNFIFPPAPAFPESDSELEWEQFEAELEETLEKVKEIMLKLLPDHPDMEDSLDQVFYHAADARRDSIDQHLGRQRQDLF